MATHIIPILGANTVPDSSGNCWMEPYTVLATNDVWGFLVWRFGAANDAAPTTRIGLRGMFRVPTNYVDTAVILVEWTSTLTSNDVEWDFDYRAIGGDDAESMDQSGTQESVNNNDTAPSAAHERLVCSLDITDANLAAGDLVEFELFRDGTDGGDTLAGSAIVFGAYFSYADV
jgi:hypothetical protein